jgi:hypothetical protein
VAAAVGAARWWESVFLVLVGGKERIASAAIHSCPSTYCRREEEEEAGSRRGGGEPHTRQHASFLEKEGELLRLRHSDTRTSVLQNDNHKQATHARHLHAHTTGRLPCALAHSLTRHTGKALSDPLGRSIGATLSLATPSPPMSTADRPQLAGLIARRAQQTHCEQPPQAVGEKRTKKQARQGKKKLADGRSDQRAQRAGDRGCPALPSKYPRHAACLPLVPASASDDAQWQRRCTLKVSPWMTCRALLQGDNARQPKGVFQWGLPAGRGRAHPYQGIKSQQRQQEGSTAPRERPCNRASNTRGGRVCAAIAACTQSEAATNMLGQRTTTYAVVGGFEVRVFAAGQRRGDRSTQTVSFAEKTERLRREKRGKKNAHGTRRGFR